MLLSVSATVGGALMMPAIDYRSTLDVPLGAILSLYKVKGWSAAKRPGLLHKALVNSETLISARNGLVGLDWQTRSPKRLVAYYPERLLRADELWRRVSVCAADE